MSEAPEQEPNWLTADQVHEIHDHALAERGGIEGVKDRGALESAVARPQQFYHYEGERDICALAALYAEGIINNHAFNDGNKRTGYLAGDVFLSQNGRDLQPARDVQERASLFVKVAEKQVSRDELGQFYRDSSIERERSQQTQTERAPDRAEAVDPAVEREARREASRQAFIDHARTQRERGPEKDIERER